MLELTAALLRRGATAAKNECTGLTHGRDRWLALAEQAYLPTALYYAWVKRPLSDEVELYTCDMHLLGAPDVELESAAPCDPDALNERIELIDGLALYLLTERPSTGIQDGEGFRLTPMTPRWLLHRRPCLRYEEDDFFYNPHGYWRMTPA